MIQAKIMTKHHDIEIPATHINILYHWLLNKGYNKQSLLNGAIVEEVFDDAERYIPLSQQYAFIQNAIQLTQNELLGLEVGHHIGAQSFGLLGYAIKCSPNLDKALDIISRYFQLRNPLFIVNKVIKPKKCMLQFDEAIEFDQAKCFLYLMFTSAAITLFNSTVDQISIIKAIHLTIAKPSAWQDNDYPKIEFCFGSTINSIVFNCEYLDKNIYSSDPITLQNLQEYFELKSANNEEKAFSNQVRRAIGKCLLESKSPSQDEVASVLNLSTRSLRRKLQDLGTSYQDILNSVRAEKSIRLLKNRKLPIYQICELMGYHDASNFRRAFFSWTGKNLKDFRH